jgi:hypothetical protein
MLSDGAVYELSVPLAFEDNEEILCIDGIGVAEA